MKPKFNHSHKGFSGKVDGLVYGMYNSDQICIARRFVKSVATTQTTLMGAIAINLGTLYKTAQATYIADLKTYSRKYRARVQLDKQLPPSSKALFIKMFWAWHKISPVENDLSVVTLADIIDKNIACKSVKDAVDAGYLPRVDGYETLNHMIA